MNSGKKGGGLFLELSKRSQLTGNTTELDEAIRSPALTFFLSDPGPIIVYACQWPTDWLTQDLVEN